MKVLAVHKDATQIARVGTHLRELGHEVDTATDRATACNKLLKSVPEVVVVDPNLPFADGLALLKILRSVNSAYIYIVAATRALDDDQLRQIYDAGVDGEVRGLELPDLRSRFVAIKRQLQRIAKPAAAPEPAKPAAKPDVAKPEVAEPQGRSELDLRAICNAISAGLGTMVALPASTAAPEPGATLAHAAGISLADVERELTVYVSLGVAHDSAAALSTHMFGEANDELATDMLSELANIAMGATKSTLARTGYTFTGSLPAAIAPAQLPSFGASSQRREAVSVVLASARIHLSVMVASAQNTTVTIDNLREGMVLTKDVFNARGVLVLAAKTRLSETSVARLRGMLPPQSRLEIAGGG